jgi:hypothetical protein
VKVEEDELRNVLREAISNVNKKRVTVDKTKELMYSMYNITAGETAFILNGKLPVDLMQKDMLFKVAKVLWELEHRPEGTFNINKLNVDDYFTEDEKKVYNKKINRKKQDKDIIIKAGNWMQVEEDQYIIKIYPDELLNDYINRDKINYNPDTQRYLTTLKTKEGDDIQIITFDEDACDDIFNDMSNNMYISNVLALNVNPDYNAPPRVLNGNIVIPNKSQIDCIDGYHRLRAAINTKIRNPEWNQPLVFFLFICDVQKACRYILEEDKKIHLSKEQVTKSDELDAVNFIIKKLNDDANFILRNTITNNKYTVVNKVISKLFDPSKLYTQEDRQNAVKLYQTIKENINNYIENNNLYGIEVTKEMWFIYLYVLKYCENDQKLDFSNIINSLDMNALIIEMNFTNAPSDNHYRILKEVLQNV